MLLALNIIYKKHMNMKTCGWICILAGLWLVAAPFVLGYSGNNLALWNDITLGIIVLGTGSYMFSSKKQK